MNTQTLTLLLTIGSAFGADLINNPTLKAVIASAVTGVEGLIVALTNKSSTEVAPPVFIAVFQAALSVLEADNKLTAGQVQTLSNALQATLTADQQAQQSVDPTTVPNLPTIS